MISRSSPEYLQVAGAILARFVDPQSAARVCGDVGIQGAAVRTAIAITDRLFAEIATLEEVPSAAGPLATVRAEPALI